MGFCGVLKNACKVAIGSGEDMGCKNFVKMVSKYVGFFRNTSNACSVCDILYSKFEILSREKEKL